MTIDIRGAAIATTPAMLEYVARRIQSALGRLGANVRGVVVRLGDANGPRGGIDKTCRVLARMRTGPVIIDEIDRDLYVAIDRAADRLRRAAVRAIDRRRIQGA